MFNSLEGCCPRIIFLDLDGTVWDSRDISSLSQPLRLVGRDEILGANGVRARLYPGVRVFLSSMNRLGLPVYSLSWNKPDVALRALEILGLKELFKGHFIEPHPHKGRVMRRALSIVHPYARPENIVYIDDRDIHLEEIRSLVGPVCFLRMWRDVAGYREVSELIYDAKNKCDEEQAIRDGLLEDWER